MATESISKRCHCTDHQGRQYGTKCPKLRRPGGTWSPHHGTWRYQLELPPHPDGRRRQLRRGGFDDRDTAIRERDHAKHLLTLAGTDTDLRTRIATLLQEVPAGQRLPGETAVDELRTKATAAASAAATTTVADYLDRWLAGRRGLSESTIRCYGDHIRLYLTPHLGQYTIAELGHHHIEAMFTAIIARNHQIQAARTSPDPAVRATVRGVRTMGDGSMQRLRATLRKALNDAIRKHRLRDTNPAEGIELQSGKPPKPRVWTSKAIEAWQLTEKRPSPVMVWRPEHAGAFLDWTEHHLGELYPMFLLILHRGLRRGEACAIRDHDIDLDTGVLTISIQNTTVGYKVITKPVKTDAGDRTIPIGPKTVAVLRAYLQQRATWKKNQENQGKVWPDTGWFFVQPDGKPWHPAAVSDRFERAIKRSGLPPVRLHDLRHCAATYLRHGGADLKEVQETLGHAQLAITADIYTSLILELRTETADAAADVIPRTNKLAA